MFACNFRSYLEYQLNQPHVLNFYLSHLPIKALTPRKNAKKHEKEILRGTTIAKQLDLDILEHAAPRSACTHFPCGMFSLTNPKRVI